MTVNLSDTEKVNFASVNFSLKSQPSQLGESLLKPKAIIAGITENPATQIFFIHFSIDNFNANISLYTLSCPKLKFRYYLTFEIMF